MSLVNSVNFSVGILYFICAWVSRAPQLSKCTKVLVMLVWVLQGVGLFLLVVHSQRFGFSQALSLSVWITLAVLLWQLWRPLLKAVDRPFFKQMRIPPALLIICGLSVFTTLLYPAGMLLHAQSKFVIAHWALGMVAYGLFAVALFYCFLLWYTEKALHTKHAERIDFPLLALEHITYRFIAVGFGVLTASLLIALTGYAGHFRLDHKVLFSILAWILYAVLLYGHYQLGWRGRFALRWFVLGTVCLFLAYVGSRFVVQVLLERA